MTIKAIYFDLGGVLFRTEDTTPRSSLGAEFGMSYAEMDAFVFECKTAALASVGKMSEKEHWLDVTRRLNLPESEMPRVHESFFGGDRLDAQLIDFLRDIRKTHKTGLISNAWDGLRAWIGESNFGDIFDEMFISAEIGFAKPDTRIYQFALEKLGIRAEEAIFVDDVQKNISACEALGMRGVLFRNTGQTLAEIQQHLSG